MATLSVQQLGMKLDTAEAGALIANMINHVARLDILILSGNTIGVEASEVIADALSRRPTLQKAILADMFTGRLKTEIPIVLHNLSRAMTLAGVQLTELDLSDNAIGPQAIGGIEEFLSSRPCYSLQKLYINNCGMANRLIECKKNAEKDGHHFALKVFIAGRNRQENPGAKALADMFKVVGTLERIELPQNGIRPEGIVALAKSFEFCERLRYLNLNDNSCTRVGAKALTDSFIHLHNLEYVDIGDCLCRRETINIVGSLLESAPKLKYLDVSGNELLPELAEEIFEMVSQIDGFQTLRIGLNCFGSALEDVKQNANNFPIFVDFGDDEDDQGSLSGYSDEDDTESLEEV